MTSEGRIINKSHRFLSFIAAGVLLLVSAFTIVSSAVSAKEDTEESKSPVLQISPTMRRLDLKPGEKQAGEMTVHNAGEVEFSFKVYAAPYTVVGDDYEPNFSNETNYTQISRWIKFEGEEYTIAPGKDQIIKYTVAVPQDVPAGGQYATIFAETINEDASKTSGLQAVSRVGMIVYASIEGAIRAYPPKSSNSISQPSIRHSASPALQLPLASKTPATQILKQYIASRSSQSLAASSTMTSRFRSSYPIPNARHS
ncbi:MAG: hypothetical protein ACK5MU_03125 [Candidatus Saccharimonadales bacterium]